MTKPTDSHAGFLASTMQRAAAALVAPEQVPGVTVLQRKDGRSTRGYLATLNAEKIWILPLAEGRNFVGRQTTSTEHVGWPGSPRIVESCQCFVRLEGPLAYVSDASATDTCVLVKNGIAPVSYNIVDLSKMEHSCPDVLTLSRVVGEDTVLQKGDILVTQYGPLVFGFVENAASYE